MPALIRFFAVLLLAAGQAPVSNGAEDNTYQVVGKVVQRDGSAFPGVTIEVFLHGAITPFHSQTLAGRDGKFKFKRIAAGTYTLVAAVPRVGELQRTIEVSPSFADSKRTVSVTLAYDQNLPVRRGGLVSTAELSVSEDAAREFRRAEELLSRRDIKGAVERLRKAVALSPQFATAWNLLGTIAYQTRQYGRAEECFRESLKQDAEAYAPLVNLGGVLLALNRFDESLKINQAAVKAMPGDPLAHSQLGKSYFYLGRFGEAEEQLKRAKALDPGHFSYPQINLIEIYLRGNRLPEAVAEMEEFLRLHPDSDWAPRIRKALAAAREFPATPH